MDDPTSEATTASAVEEAVEEAVEAATSVVPPAQDLMKLSELLPTAPGSAVTAVEAVVVDDQPSTMTNAQGMLICFKDKTKTQTNFQFVLSSW